MFFVDIQRRFQMHMRGFYWTLLKGKGGCLSEVMNQMLLGLSSLPFSKNQKRKRLSRSTILMEVGDLLELTTLQPDTKFDGATSMQSNNCYQRDVIQAEKLTDRYIIVFGCIKFVLSMVVDEDSSYQQAGQVCEANREVKSRKRRTLSFASFVFFTHMICLVKQIEFLMLVINMVIGFSFPHNVFEI